MIGRSFTLRSTLHACCNALGSASLCLREKHEIALPQNDGHGEPHRLSDRSNHSTRSRRRRQRKQHTHRLVALHRPKLQRHSSKSSDPKRPHHRYLARQLVRQFVYRHLYRRNRRLRQTMVVVRRHRRVHPAKKSRHQQGPPHFAQSIRHRWRQPPLRRRYDRQFGRRQQSLVVLLRQINRRHHQPH